MGKYIKKFNSLSDANTQGTNGLFNPHVDIIKDYNVVNFVKTSSEKFTCSFNNTTGLIENVTPVSQGHALGDICYWDGSKLAYVPYTQWQSSLGTALAVCFIPTSHAQVWGDGKARFLSVKGVNDDGTAATSEQYLFWDSEDNYRDAGLTKRTRVPTWDNTVGGSVGGSIYGYLSGDALRQHAEDEGETAIQNTIDTNGYYFTWGDNTFIPSPYATDGSFYSDYMRTISGNNALSDFNGKTNTADIVTALGADGGQAAKACSLYSTNGIAAGQWYLPACGELGYIIPRFNVIQSALTACDGVLLDSYSRYWSSTEYDSSNAYFVDSNYGGVYYFIKDYGYYVRPVVSLA